MYKFGWVRDYADFRDLNESSSQIKSILDRSTNLKTAKTTLSTCADLRQWFTPIENQGDLGSCTANAAAGLVEYYENKAYGKFLNASRLFIYKATRNLMGLTGDTGASLRDTMKALVLFGAPDEKYWPYVTANFEKEPTAFIYSLGQNFKAMQYYRLDVAGVTPQNLLMSIKQKLSAGLPQMFGFSVYSSISGFADIPFPRSGDRLLGGHAIITCGYDDSRTIGGLKGALMIRNSWGTSWGNQGYGWLPYQYVLSGLANDFWSLVQSSYVDTSLFV